MGGSSVRIRKSVDKIIKRLVEQKWILFILIALWLGLEYIGLGPFSYIRINDTGDLYITQYILLTKDFFRHGITYWFPYIGSGVDRLANDMLYPHFTTILFGIFPGWIAYQLIILVQFFLGGYFTYRLCRDYLKLSDVSSIYAGITFAFFSNDAIHFQLGILAFPFILWAIEKISYNNTKSRYLWVILLGILYSFCSSLPWTLPFSLVAAFAWFILVRRKLTFDFLLLFFVFGAIALVCQLSPIWAMLANAELSNRTDWKAIWIDLPSELLALLNKSKFFLLRDKLSLFLALIAILFFRLKHRRFLILLGLFLSCSIGVLVVNVLEICLIEHIGFFRGFQFDRFYELAPFFGALCGAYALELITSNWILVKNVQDKSKTWQARTIVGIVIVLVVFLGTLTVKREHILTWIKQGSYTANYKSNELQKLSRRPNNEPFRVATIAYDMHPVYANAYGLEAVDGYISLYPKTYQKFWSKIIGPLTKQNDHIDRYFNQWGLRIYLFTDDKVLSEASGIEFSKYYNLNLLSLANTKYLISKLPLRDEELSLILPSQAQYERDWRNFSRIEKRLQMLKDNFRGRSCLYIYENKASFPRFFLTKKVKSFKDSDQLLNSMSEAELNQLRDTVFIEEKYLNNVRSDKIGYNYAHITVGQYEPDKIKLRIEIDGSGILVVTNSYSPYWKCEVNGVKTDIFPVYHTFWGIYIEKTDKEVTFYYDPPYRIFKIK